jgi:FkbM family methyltransferase
MVGYLHVTCKCALGDFVRGVWRIRRKLKNNPLIWFALSIFSSMRVGKFLTWSFDGVDWQLKHSGVSIFTNRFEIDPNWLLKGHPQFFEKKYTPKSCDRILDLGGGLGTDLPRWSNMVGEQGHIWVFEPDSDAFRRSSKLVKSLPLANITVINSAVSNYKGSGKLAKVSANSQNNYLMQSKGSNVDGINLETVSVVTLDEFFNEYNIDFIDFCKINVEGEELKLLEGLKGKIRFIRNIVVSCHDFLGLDFATFDETRKLLLKNGFEVTYNTDSLNEVEKFYLYGENLSK